MADAKPVEPGEKLTIGYGNGKTADCQALSLRQKRKVAECMDVITSQDATAGARLDAVENALRLCWPGMPEETLDAIDDSQAMEIVSNVLRNNSLTAEQAKKSE